MRLLIAGEGEDSGHLFSSVTFAGRVAEHGAYHDMSGIKHFPAEGVRLTQVKVLRTGIDGGHTYIKGRGDVPGHGEQDIYAYFKTTEEEKEFERQFSGQSVVLDGDSLEFTPSHSTAIRHIISWKFK